jgi:hypothetical protein
MNAALERIWEKKRLLSNSGNRRICLEGLRLTIVRAAGVPAVTRTHYLMNRSRESRRCTNLFEIQTDTWTCGSVIEAALLENWE